MKVDKYKNLVTIYEMKMCEVFKMKLFECQ